MELPWEKTDMLGEEDKFEPFDKKFKQKFGKDPDTIIKEEDAKIVDVDAEEVDGSSEPQPPSEPPHLPPAEQLADELAAWIKDLGRTPSLDEIRDHLLSELGIQEVSSTVMKGMVWLLRQRGIEI